MKLRIGLVGLGDDWESRYRPALRSLSDRFEVRAVCEEVALRAQQAARQFDAVAVDGYQALAARSDIDAVLILSTQWYGSLPILAACEHGKAVYCANTWDISSDEAHEIKKRVEDSGVAFMAEFPRRVAPATIRLKELIVTRLGKPRLMFCHHRRALDPSKHFNQRHRLAPCDSANTRVLLELIDWCNYVVGSGASSVSSFWHRSADDRYHDYQVVSLDFSNGGTPGNGPLAQISCGSYMPSTWHEAVSFRPPAALQVCCEKGVAFIDLPATLIWFDEAGRHMESLESERPVGEQLLSQFHRAVTSLVRSTASLEDAFRALRVLMMAKESFHSGERQSLNGKLPL